MPKNVITERPCKECKKLIEYKPRRINCLDCYKKKSPLNTPEEVKFIDDDD